MTVFCCVLCIRGQIICNGSGVQGSEVQSGVGLCADLILPYKMS
jgi:hypothetical protein